MARVAFVFLGIPVTTFCAAVVSVTAPAEVALGGAASVSVTVTPAGMLALSCAVMRYVLLGFGVVTVYVVAASLTDVGCDPATAVVMRSNAGLPETVSV
jgi:hypothetical protein